MKVVIVYESMFGNTEALALSVLDGLTEGGAEVTMVEAVTGAATAFISCDLVVLGAPTHALTLSRPETRADAVARGADPVHATSGVREWLESFDRAGAAASTSPAIAVFDTRMTMVRHWPGSAARRAARVVRKAGFTVVARTSFYVDEIEGPVAAGEHDRARRWGQGLVAARANASGHHPA